MRCKNYCTCRPCSWRYRSIAKSTAVLSKEQIDRLEEAETADEPVKIVTNAEALENEKEQSKDEKTWHFKAENVRDYAFATSRKYIWDAIGVEVGGNTAMAMSYYPNEAEPLGTHLQRL